MVIVMMMKVVFDNDDDDDDGYLVMKVILVKEVMSCDVSPVAMFGKMVSPFFLEIDHRFLETGLAFF